MRAQDGLIRQADGGTGATTEAIQTFEKGDFPDLVYQAVKAAYEKSQKPGTGLKTGENITS